MVTLDDDRGYSVLRPLPSVAVGDKVGLLSSKDAPGTRITSTAIEPSSYYRGRHSRGNSRDERLRSIDESDSMRDVAFEMMEPSMPSKARRPSAGPSSSASSMLRRLTTKYAPLSRSNLRSTGKRSHGRHYATLGDGDVDQGAVAAAVDISSLEGMGWELTDLSNPDADADAHPALLQDIGTAYVPPSQRRGGSNNKSMDKPGFRSFVDKRRSVGEGMRDIGVQLRRDPTKVVRKHSSGAGEGAARNASTSTGIDRSKTVRDFGQNLAQEKNMIVEVEEVVDLSSLDGGGRGQFDIRGSSQMTESMSMRNSSSVLLPQRTKSYFFPEDPDIPNWKPWSMKSVYILSLMVLAFALAGFQEYLCQRSLRSARRDSGLLAFNSVADISTWDFFAWKYLPTMITIMYAVVFSIMDFDIRRLEPFYQLSRPRGARAAASLNLDHLTMFQYFVPFKAFRLKQWAVLFSTTGNIVASMAAPALQNPSIKFVKNPECHDGACPSGDDKQYWVRVSPVWSRLLSASYLFVAVVLVMLFIQLRRKSGLLSDPKGIAGIASMATKSHIVQDFAGLDVADRKEIHKRLQHRRYLLYKSSIWQGEWSETSERIQDSERKLTSPHPVMLRIEAAIPFLLFMVFCLVSVPIITLTPANVVPNAAPWLPIVVATGLKLLFSTFEADVRLMEPFYQLSKGNARPENSLTLDYQATAYGWMPIRALWKRHYLVALVGCSSVALDVLTVTVGSFSVNARDFLKVGGEAKDVSMGDETFISFWASLALSVVILIFVIFTTSLVYLRRRHPFLPREPSTIAAVLAFIYASNMLTDFIDTEHLDNKHMELRLKTLGKRYALGWFRGRDGQIHCAIDEEPIKSKYVHGKPYTMAQAGPLLPIETYYSV
ncbi:hypothetical protein A1O1_04875 [Capronia coronata CBS 617.96]|uniref:Uncharacterized protein n=1 Tax=Capronia coronata CBS 617.96 TaxID=1182541 RepID=W9Y5Z5_9EURO|nr:uncharacterized protein A1O1_04875 [Capronia coronata CBS 617.96]EXJ87948.1 hypothetical protein A1O1_04875 [Capronia coronata CBS 617.96]